MLNNNTNITSKPQIDTPKGLVLSDMERILIEGLASQQSASSLSIQHGIPKIVISNLLRKPGVAEFLQEIIDARNTLMKMALPDLLMSIIEDKIAKNREDEDSRLADLTRKDVVDIAKELNGMLKTTGSVARGEIDDQFSKIYQQINIIQGGDK